MDMNTFSTKFRYYSGQRKRNIRTYWIHSVVKDRYQLDSYQILMSLLSTDEMKFSYANVYNYETSIKLTTVFNCYYSMQSLYTLYVLYIIFKIIF